MRNLLTSILALVLLSGAATQVQSHQAKSSQTFASFWLEFKGAVAKNDKEAVATMTNFPFYLDQELTKSQFIKRYGEIFSPKIQRCFAKAKPIKEVVDDAYSVFCGHEIYAFARIDGKYKFTSVGADDADD